MYSIGLLTISLLLGVGICILYNLYYRRIICLFKVPNLGMQSALFYFIAPSIPQRDVLKLYRMLYSLLSALRYVLISPRILITLWASSTVLGDFFFVATVNGLNASHLIT